MKHLKPRVIKFEYNLIYHPKEWVSFEGVVLKENERNVWLWCVRNQHVAVFGKKGLRNIERVKI